MPSFDPAPDPTSSPSGTSSGRRQLRRELRRRRRSLNKYQQARAARQLFRRLRRDPLFRRSRRVAFYLASAREGEIDPDPLMRLAARRGKRCYLPVMRRDGQDRLLFVRHRPGGRLRRGPFGILEPPLNPRRVSSARALGLVLMPLVGFDTKGNRMGMGKGFYDRTFAFRRRSRRHCPRLLGIAHECQRVASLPAAPWDVPLDAVATPERIYRLPGGAESPYGGDDRPSDEE